MEPVFNGNRPVVFALLFAATSVLSCRKKPTPPTPLPLTPQASASATLGIVDAGSASAVVDAGSPEAAEAPLPPECLALTKKNKAAWDKAPGCSPTSDVYDSCVVSANGSVWAIAVEDVDNFGNQPTAPCSFTWKLVYFAVKDTKGAKADSGKPLTRVDALAFQGSSRFGSSGPRRVIGAGDTLFIEVHEEGAYGETPENRGSVYSAQNNKIVPYPPLVGHEVADVTDLDDDGRLDYVLATPFRANRALGRPTAMHYNLFEGPRPAAHVLADNTLSFDDKAAQSLVRRECPSKPRNKPPKIKLVDAGSKGEPMDAFEPLTSWLPCAKFWGIPSEQIDSALAQCVSFIGTAGLDSDDFRGEKIAEGACPQHLSDWANAKVPFVLK